MKSKKELVSLQDKIFNKFEESALSKEQAEKVQGGKGGPWTFSDFTSFNLQGGLSGTGGPWTFSEFTSTKV